jgi:NADP-dependent aldehyde dehydrogenase
MTAEQQESPVVADTRPEELDRLADAAVAAARQLVGSRPSVRAGWLEALADRLDAAAEELVPLAVRETHLTTDRLRGELKRTTFQLRLFATVLRDGEFLQATIDHSDPGWPMGPRPDLRRMLRPIGPVAVYAASNFPFAFSVAGGDTASALAAGCPVLLKAHPSHPELSVVTGRHVVEALRDSGAPEGIFAVVTGFDVGIALVQDPRIRAASFTGSVGGGRALFDLAVSRPDPIPFYGELGSVNPAFVTAEAGPVGRRRGGRIRRLGLPRQRPVLHQARPAVRTGRLRAGAADRRPRRRPLLGADVERADAIQVLRGVGAPGRSARCPGAGGGGHD